MASSREKGADDVRGRIVRSFVVENASSGSAVGLLGSANSCAVTRVDSSKWRCGATHWIGAKSGGGVDFVETVESAIGNRTRSSEGAVGENFSANAHAEASEGGWGFRRAGDCRYSWFTLKSNRPLLDERPSDTVEAKSKNQKRNRIRRK